MHFIQFASIMLAIFAYYAGIMLKAFTTHYAQNYAGIIG